MAKDKTSNLPKKKKKELSSNAEDIIDAEVKGKRRKKEVEEVLVQIPQDTTTTTAEDKKQKKEKKRKKKRAAEETQANETEISDPPSCPEPPRELEGEEDLSPEQKRMMERKMKKILKKEEKKRLRTEGETEKRSDATPPTAPQQALLYLTCWSEKRTEWKFQKTRQTWLLQHMFESDKIPDENFSVLLQYLEGLRGGAKDTTVKKALVLVEESGQAPEDKAVQQRAHRAREVIQLLS